MVDNTNVLREQSAQLLQLTQRDAALRVRRRGQTIKLVAQDQLLASDARLSRTTALLHTHLAIALCRRGTRGPVDRSSVACPARLGPDNLRFSAEALGKSR